MLVGCWTIGVRSLSCQGIEEYPNHQISPSLNAKKEMTRTWQIPLCTPSFSKSHGITVMLYQLYRNYPRRKTRKCRDIFGKLPFQLSLKFSLCFPTQQLSNLSFFQFKSQSESVIRISDTANCARCRVNTRYHPCDGFQYGVNFPHCFQFHTHVNLSFIISGNEVVMCIILK